MERKEKSILFDILEETVAPCIICGAGVTLTKDNTTVCVCDNCKKAVMTMRKITDNV